MHLTHVTNSIKLK